MIVPRMVTVTYQVEENRMPAFQELLEQFETGRARQDEDIRKHAHDQAQGVVSLHYLFEIAQDSDGDQSRCVAAFLLSLYNGQRFPFDLTNLRGLDTDLFEHCMTVLRLDHRPDQEVHEYFENGNQLWEDMADLYRVVEVASLKAATRQLMREATFQTPEFLRAEIAGMSRWLKSDPADDR